MMEDNVSIKSTDSVTTSGEYEIVPELIDCSPTEPHELTKKSQQPPARSPTLNIANNGDFHDLEKNLNEVIHELEDSTPIHRAARPMDAAAASTSQQLSDDGLPVTGNNTIIHSSSPLLTIPSTTKSTVAAPAAALETTNKVGQSIFYDCLDLSPTAEKQDDMKPERSDTEEEMSEIDQDCTIFAGVTYLGAASINAPKSEIEILRNLSEMNGISEASAVGIKVSVSIPSCPEGVVVLYDAATNAVIAHYEVHRILFYARGSIGSVDQACFAFTWSHGDCQESAVFQCHVFKCLIPEAVTQVGTCFSKAFRRVPPSLTGSVTSPVDNPAMVASITSDITGNPISSAEYEFIVSLEIREKVAKNSLTSVPRDRSCFRLRVNVDKEIAISVKQTHSNKLPALYIERCFGVLMSPGQLVRQADMHLLDMVSMGYSKVDQVSTVTNVAAATATTTSSNSATNTNAAGGATMAATNTNSSWLQPYLICAEWKSTDKNFESLNVETSKMFITVAVDLVIKGIQEPVRFVIETPITILGQSEMRLMDHFFTVSKRAMLQRFYLQLKDNGFGGWEVNSIDPSEEIVEPAGQNSILKNLGINSFTRMVRSTSTVSIEDDSPTDYSSDGDEPLLSGTGEVSKDCSQDTLDEWGPILQEWDGEKRPKNLTQLVRLSVPEALRGKVWQKLANVENKVEMTDRYRVLLTKETDCETVIQRDIHRTFPAHKFFRETGGTGQDALFKVSKAYAVYDLEVGYCQGLSFVAASLLLHMPEEEAFCVLIALMYDYGLRDLYKERFENLYLRLYQLNRLMKDQLPKLYEHFERTGVETHMFASQWFLTLFTARFPLYFVFHILDMFLLDGMPILFQVAITLLSVCESELRQLDFEGILKYVRITLPKKCRNESQARKIMKMACERKMKKLKQYEDEFLANKELSEKEELLTKQQDQRFNEERQRLKAETIVLQAKFDQVVERNRLDEKKTAGILLDYKQIIQRQEQQITQLTGSVDEMTKSLSACASCSTKFGTLSTSPLRKTNANHMETTQQIDAPLGPLDPVNVALQRVRELELALAQTKLAHVEAECKIQDLNHQLNSNMTEMTNTNRNSWQPWLSKTFNTIQEKVTPRRDQVASFQSYTVGGEVAAPVSFQETNRDHGSPKNVRPRINATVSLNRNSLDYTKNETAMLKQQLPYSRNSLK